MLKKKGISIVVSDLADSEFENKVINSNTPVLLDMWAPWCGPCRMIAPVVERLSEQYSGRVEFYRMNVDENPLTPTKFRVMSIPTLILFKSGEAVDTIIGAVTERVIAPKLDAVLNKD